MAQQDSDRKKGKRRSSRDTYAGDTAELRIPPAYREAPDYDQIPPARNLVRNFRTPAEEEAERRREEAAQYREQYYRERACREREEPADDRSYIAERGSRPAARPRRRSPGCLGSLLRFVGVVALSCFLLYSAAALLVISRLDRVPRGERHVRTGTLDKSYVRSVLLIGTDARDPASEYGRSDSMILLTLNDRTHAVGLNSLMRDAYVQIPGYGGGRLNAAYAYGGPELLLDTIEQNYNVRVDDYVCVSFQGFAGVVDAVGGVEITITDEEAEAINRMLQGEINVLLGEDTAADLLPAGGTFTLNGRQALSYSRIRYVGNADFERTERQRDVIEQIGESARRNFLSNVPRMLESTTPHISTNMTTAELYLLSLRVPFLFFYDIAQQQIPADGTWSPDNVNGESVLRVDFDANERVLRDGAYAG